MRDVNVIAMILKAELFHEIKAFVDARDKRCRPGDPRWEVTPTTLMDLKLKFAAVSLERLEMLAALYRNGEAGVCAWMQSLNQLLNNNRPIDLLATGDGVRAVEGEIDRLFRRLASDI